MNAPAQFPVAQSPGAPPAQPALGLFYWIVDVRGWSRRCVPFVWIGMNPITLYRSTRFLSDTKSAEMFLGGDVKAFLDARAQGLGDLVVGLGTLGFVFLLAWLLHRRKIFLRVERGLRKCPESRAHQRPMPGFRDTL